MERQHYTPENRCSIGQAESMARFAGIELTTEEIKMYTWARQSDDPDFMGMSDQNILDVCLSPEKQIVFEQKFNNIRFI